MGHHKDHWDVRHSNVLGKRREWERVRGGAQQKRQRQQKRTQKWAQKKLHLHTSCKSRRSSSSTHNATLVVGISWLMRTSKYSSVFYFSDRALSSVRLCVCVCTEISKIIATYAAWCFLRHLWIHFGWPKTPQSLKCLMRVGRRRLLQPKVQALQSCFYWYALWSVNASVCVQGICATTDLS